MHCREFLDGFATSWLQVRGGAGARVRLLQSILQRLFVVALGDLEVVLSGDLHAVADPGARHVGRKLVRPVVVRDR